MKRKNLIKLVIAILAITFTIIYVDNLLYQINHSQNLIENRIKTDNSRLHDSIIISKMMED